MANRVYYLDRSGATPQVRIANDRQKVKKYASIVDAQTDLSNIGTGEIIATEDGDLNLVNAWIGTQAQYDALTDLPDDTVCFIIDPGDNEYSTDETVTDKTWIDGKPIYRKVLVCTAATTLGTDTNVPGWSISTSNVNTLIKAESVPQTFYTDIVNNTLVFNPLVSSSISVNQPLIIEYTKN